MNSSETIIGRDNYCTSVMITGKLANIESVKSRIDDLSMIEQSLCSIHEELVDGLAKSFRILEKDILDLFSDRRIPQSRLDLDWLMDSMKPSCERILLMRRSARMRLLLDTIRMPE